MSSLKLLRTRSRIVTMGHRLTPVSLFLMVGLTGCMEPAPNSSAQGGSASDVALNGNQDPRFTKKNIEFQQRLEMEKLRIDAKNAENKEKENFLDSEQEKVNGELEYKAKIRGFESAENIAKTEAESARDVEEEKNNILTKLIENAPDAIEAGAAVIEAGATVDEAKANAAKAKGEVKAMEAQARAAEKRANNDELRALAELVDKTPGGASALRKTAEDGLNKSRADIEALSQELAAYNDLDRWEKNGGVQTNPTGAGPIYNQAIAIGADKNIRASNKAAASTALAKALSNQEGFQQMLDGLSKIPGGGAPDSGLRSSQQERLGFQADTVQDWVACVSTAGELGSSIDPQSCNMTHQSASSTVDLSDLLNELESVRAMVFNSNILNEKDATARKQKYQAQNIGSKIGTVREKIVQAQPFNDVERVRLQKLSNLLDALEETGALVQKKLDNNEAIQNVGAIFTEEAGKIKTTKPKPGTTALALFQNIDTSSRRPSGAGTEQTFHVAYGAPGAGHTGNGNAESFFQK